MNILVTGANGQLGSSLRRLSSSFEHRFVFTDVNDIPGVETVKLDITDKNAIQEIVCREKIDTIINCAAYTNVDKAEDDEATAALLNCRAPQHLAEAAASAGAVLIHVSTDYVFSGEGFIPLKASDKPAPCSVYGSTKLQGEEAIAQTGCKYIIVRTAWLYSEFGKNFCKTMLSLTADKEQLKVVYDQLGSPTYAADLAAALLTVACKWDRKSNHIFHYSNQGAISWFDFANAINEIAGHKCRIEPCLSGEFPSKVRRPHYSVMDKSEIIAAFGVEVPYWRESLVKCINNIQNG